MNALKDLSKDVSFQNVEKIFASIAMELSTFGSGFTGFRRLKLTVQRWLPASLVVFFLSVPTALAQSDDPNPATDKNANENTDEDLSMLADGLFHVDIRWHIHSRNLCTGGESPAESIIRERADERRSGLDVTGLGRRGKCPLAS